MKKRFFVLLGLAVSANIFAAPNCPSEISPGAGKPPTSEQAVALVLPALKKKFGVADISATMPFHATLWGDLWHVRGTLPKGTIGGTAEAYVCKTNSKIVEIFHTQ
jgi:hypothetical protein